MRGQFKTLTTFAADALIFMTAVLVGGTCLADIIQNYHCGPIANWVSSCGCPQTDSSQDWCEGALPKNGSTQYGDVACIANLGTCNATPSGNGNSCGRVVRTCTTCCSGGACYGPPPTYVTPDGSGCTYFYYDQSIKPQCSNPTWGYCVWGA